MSNYQKTLKVLALLLPVFFLLFVLSTGCETEKEVIKEVEVVVHDTVIVEITVHDTILVNGVEVDTIVASTDTIAQGGTVMFTASASTPVDNDFTYTWFATAGTFTDQTESGDTAYWKAPDEPQAVEVTVHATDGTFIGMGSTTIGVGMYVPTETNYYLGDAACSGCHSGTHTEWSETGHAHAWASLQSSSHAASYCAPCHAIGWEFSLVDSEFVWNAGDGGYDEAPIQNYVDVQCEACHGPASEHTGNPSGVHPEVSWDVLNCGKCHDGTHHPYLTEWAESPHNFDPYTSSHGAGARGSCSGCHEGVAAAYRFQGDLSVFYGSGEVLTRPDTTDVGVQPVNCQTCHDPHSDEYPGQVRTTADVPLVTANGESPIVTEGGTGKLCMHCHHARRGPDSQIANGYGHFGPHANPQADILKAKSASHGVAPGFTWAGPSHLLVQNSCKTCHLNMIEYPGPAGSAVTGHTFLPTVEACANCHGPITSFEDIPASGDFDGNGMVEGLQVEVDGLLHHLEQALLASGLDTTGVGFAGALGDTNLSTVEQRTAGYNLVYVEDDKSRGIHNPDYVVQLLQQSIAYLGSTLPGNARIVKGDNEAVKNW